MQLNEGMHNENSTLHNRKMVHVLSVFSPFHPFKGEGGGGGVNRLHSLKAATNPSSPTEINPRPILLSVAASSRSANVSLLLISLGPGRVAHPGWGLLTSKIMAVLLLDIPCN